MTAFLNTIPDVDLVEFDTEDNIVRDTWTPWSQNLDLETWEPLGKYGLRRYSERRMWFKSTEPVRRIKLNRFWPRHTIRRVSETHFEIYCRDLGAWFDSTDNIEVIVSK